MLLLLFHPHFVWFMAMKSLFPAALCRLVLPVEPVCLLEEQVHRQTVAVWRGERLRGRPGRERADLRWVPFWTPQESCRCEWKVTFTVAPFSTRAVPGLVRVAFPWLQSRIILLARLGKNNGGLHIFTLALYRRRHVSSKAEWMYVKQAECKMLKCRQFQ